MKKTLLLAATLAAALGMASSVQATLITGSISFNGGANLDTGSAGTATKVTTWVTPFVFQSDLSAGAVAPFTAVTIANPWNFASGPIANFWQVGGYTFDLTSSYVFSQGGSPAGVSVKGTGILKHAGFEDTVASWSFDVSDPSVGSPATWSIRASSGAVPDGGTTVMLLGAGLSCLGLIRRKLVA
ncbi:MAG TPA: VPDSG-CTERM sorting domain-containing protein [Verrucomicrobiae bacterium]|nr:VPDSG-CTERM sorting domain-containing protein [Verrucomicrobiae bacterium]